jgi:hypothetical protein
MSEIKRYDPEVTYIGTGEYIGVMEESEDAGDYVSYADHIKEIAALRQQLSAYREALERLRDCDWVITPHDRMDAVRDIARKALAGDTKENKDVHTA